MRRISERRIKMIKKLDPKKAALLQAKAKTIGGIRESMVIYGNAQIAMNVAFDAFFEGVTPENKLVLWAGVLTAIRTNADGEIVKTREFDAVTKKEYKMATTAKSRYEASRKAPTDKEEKKGFWPQRRANLDKELTMVQKLSAERAGNVDVSRVTAAYRALLQLIPK